MKILIEKQNVYMEGFDKKELLEGLTTYVKTLRNIGFVINEVYLATKEGFECKKEITNPNIKEVLKVFGMEE